MWNRWYFLQGQSSAHSLLHRKGRDIWVLLGNPLHFIDLDGRETNLADNITDWFINVCISDEQAKELVDIYVYGDGEDVVYENDPSWSEYMMENETLTDKTALILAPIGERLDVNESIDIDMTTFMVIDGDPHSGYMHLFGTNDESEMYKIQGTVSKDSNGTITYDMTYTFNDVMDPNFNYLMDKLKYNGLKLLKTLGANITMKDYNIKITWTDTTIIYAAGSTNCGWLKDMLSIVDLFSSIDLQAGAWWDEDTMNAMQEFFNTLQNLQNTYPDYYNGPTE